MKYTLFVLITMAFVYNGYSQNPTIESKAYDWKKIDRRTGYSGEIKPIFKGSSDGFEYINVFVTSVDGGNPFELPEKNDSLESLVIMKTGNVDQIVAGESKRMGPGSVTLIMPGEKLMINNKGDEPASFYVVMWKVKNLPANRFIESNESISSHLISWNDLKYEKMAKGGRRHVIRKPTAMLKEFEMHVTTLEEGMRSHPPHTHMDEEIILVRYGEVEEFIDGKLHEVGEGSLIFLRSMVPHGIRNIGKGPCEYYAFRWIPR